MKKNLKIISVVILVLVVLWFLPVPDFIAFKIGLSNTVKGAGVGITGMKPMQYRRFEMLKRVTGTNKLIRLYKNHPSAAVKCYSFWALSEISEGVDHFKLIKHSLLDDRTVSTMFGCFVSSTTVADFIIGRSENLLSVEDSLLLDSLILYSDKQLYAQQSLLFSIQPEKKYYERIRELCDEKNCSAALPALAKYQKDADLDIIKQKLTDSLTDPYYSLLAVKSFPHESFIPYLIEIQKNIIDEAIGINHVSIRALYKALVRYDDDSIKAKLEWLVLLNEKITDVETKHDSINVFDEFEKGFLESDVDSSRLGLEKYQDDNFKYVIKSNMEALRLALFDYPASSYQYLTEKMEFEYWELEMIKDEYEWSGFE